MKTLIAGAALIAAAIPALAQTNVSISVGQPGFYGHINIGDFGPPPVVYEQPVIIQQPARYYEAAPVYLRVPEGHRKHWSRFCGRYNACGQRVYFVQDTWYTNTYVPRYREVHREHYREPERRDYYQRAPERHEYREERQEGHGEHGRGHGEGHGEGHGNGHGNGHGHGHD
jgi:hypothetical protein